jgi:arylsulfatase A
MIFYKVLSFTTGISTLFLSDGCSSSDKKNDKELPNIIYVMADDLGYGDVSVFNKNGKIMTPNIDRMASEGICFTDAHSSSSVSTPTRYGILTGRYSWRSRLKQSVLDGYSDALIPEERTTVASLLKKHGYYTAFIGKWHLGWGWARSENGISVDFNSPITNGPNDLGFDYGYGHSGSLDMAPYVYVENRMATEIPTDTTENTGKYSWWRKGITSKDFVHEDVTPNFFRRGIKLIEQRAQEKSPFFLYLALPSPHTPILPLEQWQGKSGLNPYGDFVMMIDDYMGQLLEVIKKAGIEDNTLVIFTSDNGCSPEAQFDELAEKGHFPSYIYRGHKADIFEGGHRVPFIAKWPKKIKKGIISSEVICTTDLMATCAEIAGYDLADNEGEDSYSMMPLFEHRVMKKPLREATIHHSINGSFAIRKGDWKLIMCAGSGGWSFPRPEDKSVIDTLPEIQLYNLAENPGERKNLYATHPEKVEELRSLLKDYILNGRSTPGEAQNNDPYENDWWQVLNILH